MPAMIADVTVPKRAGTTNTVVHTTLYDLIAAVQDAMPPGEEASVTPIVAHLLRAGHARCVIGTGMGVSSIIHV